ncbi:MAG: hypothetical protein HFJ72_06010 [Adlercreutzia sp.]|nr:hypothetical protein [Adlercreutzia sp.]
MRFFQRNQEGCAIESLAPLVLCALVLDREFLRASLSREKGKAMRRFRKKLEPDRDAATLVRIAMGIGGLPNAMPSDFAKPSLMRMRVSAEDGLPLTVSAVNETCLGVENVAATIGKQGGEVRASYVIAFTHNPCIESGQQGAVELISFADSGYARLEVFADRCAQAILDRLDGDDL